MGTIADKLTYLNGTKTAIKTAIINKGVAVADTDTFRSYADKIAAISSGSSEWSPPADWINIEDVVDGNINLLVNDTTLATYAFVCTTSSGTYHVDWGDGTNNDYASGVKAQHTYTVDAGQSCSRGYSTFKIMVSPSTGNNLTRFYVTSHSLATQTQYHGYLWCTWGARYVTSMANAFYKSTSPVVYCRQLEFFKYVGTQTTSNISAASMLDYCTSLCGVDVSGLVSVITATEMFANCYGLQSIDISSFATAITAGSSIFQSCFALRSANVSGMGAVTNAGAMFSGCVSLKSVDISDMVSVTAAISMFSGCPSLQSVNLLNFGSSSASINAGAMFSGCEQLISITMPNAKLTSLGAAGATGKLNKLQTLTFNSASTFSGSSPQIDLQYNTLTAAQINTILSSLPTGLTGKVITVKGCTGAATCNTALAPAGWSVTIA